VQLTSFSCFDRTAANAAVFFTQFSLVTALPQARALVETVRVAVPTQADI